MLISKKGINVYNSESISDSGFTCDTYFCPGTKDFLMFGPSSQLDLKLAMLPKIPRLSGWRNISGNL